MSVLISVQTVCKKRLYQEHYQSIKQLGSKSGPMFHVCPDLGPNCFPKILSGALSEYQTAWIQIRTDVPCQS